MKFIRPLFMALAVFCGAAAVFHYVRNPEKSRLDDAARATAGGSFVTLSGGTTHYEVAGPDTGRVVLLVHGFSVPAYIWDSTFYSLSANGFRVIRYDLYGRGFSDRPNVAYDGAFYDAQVGELLDSLRVTGPVDLFGLSFGGFVVAHFASTHPTRVRTLTLVDPVTAAGSVPTALKLPLVGAYLFQTLRVPYMAEGQPGDFLHPERFPGWADRYRPQTRYRGFGRSLRSSLIHISHADFGAIYESVSSAGTPVLLVWGKQDPVVPIANAAIVTSAIPTTEFFAVDSAGHLPHLEQAQAVNARLLAFLAAHP